MNLPRWVARVAVEHRAADRASNGDAFGQIDRRVAGRVAHPRAVAAILSPNRFAAKACAKETATPQATIRQIQRTTSLAAGAPYLDAKAKARDVAKGDNGQAVQHATVPASVPAYTG